MALGKIQDAIFDFKKAIQNKARENEFIKRGYNKNSLIRRLIF